MSPALRPHLRLLASHLFILLGIVSLCLAAVHPFLQGRMPRSDDGLLQMYRSVALEHSLAADNALWPRYSSGLVYGYGAPLFNYFPPLSYYPATWLRLLGFDYAGSWLLSMALYTLAAAAGMYTLGRHWTGSRIGGWLAALAYVYAPYFLFDSVTRGTSPEVAALAALPVVLYGFTCLANYGRRRDFLLAALAFALFIPLHTLITLHGAVLLALYCLFLSWRAADQRAALPRLMLAGAAALLLTAFYWLPALLETDAIKLDLITDQLGAIEVLRNLRPLSESLAPPQRADPTQLNQAASISLGWAQIALALSGVALCLKRRNRRFRALLLFSGALTLLLIFMNTPASAALWETLPLIGYTQFPWRLLGLASLTLALMAGIGAWLLLDSIAAPTWRLGAIAGVTALLMLSALPWTFTAFHDSFEARNIGDMQVFERESGQLALSSYAEYLPLRADADHLDPQLLIDRFASGAPIARLTPSDTLEIKAQRWTGTSAELRLDSSRQQTLEFDWLYWAGWRAAIDGREIDVFPSSPAGLVALDLPGGQFDLRIALEATPVQTSGMALSALGLAAIVALLMLWRRLPELAWDAPAPATDEGRAMAVLVLVCLAVFMFKTAVLDRQDTPFKAARFGSVPEVEALANFGGRIDLLEVEMPADPITGRELRFRLFWRLHEGPLDRDYSSVIRMRDPSGHVVAEAMSFAPGGLASRNWRHGFYIEDVIALEIPPFTPPLDQAYEFDVALFESDTLDLLDLINADGNPQDVKYELGSLRYRPTEAERQAERDAFSLPSQASTAAELIHAPALPAAATAGDELRLRWTWRKNDQFTSDLRARVIWLDEAGNQAGASLALPLARGYSFARWEQGEVNRGQHTLIVPPQLPAGAYAIALETLDEQGKAQIILQLDTRMDVDAPPRRFELPRYRFEQYQAWDNGILLHGYSLGEDGDLELVWGTAGVLSESLRLFVHVLNANDRIAAQWDGVPGDWRRPTTGWLPGEYVTTRHQFVLPAGTYMLRVGWYHANSGARIGVGGGDSLRLDTALIIE